jgi:LPXTG-motif cell wall-anchored protein
MDAITFSVSLPDDMDNASGMQLARLRWIFSTEYSDKPTSGHHRGGGAKPTATVNAKNNGSGPQNPQMVEPFPENPGQINQINGADMPPTGDNSLNLYLLIAIVLISGSGIIILARRVKKTSAKEGDSDER